MLTFSVILKVFPNVQLNSASRFSLDVFRPNVPKADQRLDQIRSRNEVRIAGAQAWIWNELHTGSSGHVCSNQAGADAVDCRGAHAEQTGICHHASSSGKDCGWLSGLDLEKSVELPAMQHRPQNRIGDLRSKLGFVKMMNHQGLWNVELGDRSIIALG